MAASFVALQMRDRFIMSVKQNIFLTVLCDLVVFAHGFKFWTERIKIDVGMCKIVIFYILNKSEYNFSIFSF